MRRRVTVLGGGAFGLAAALELRRRDWEVDLFDAGKLPHPEASSTDISKAVRMDYGRDGFYTELAERALDLWDRWNADWSEPVYHEVGFLLLTREAMAPGGFEADGWELLRARGHALERMGPAQLRKRFPAWNAERYADGYLNPRAGWAASGRVVERLARVARDAGVSIHEEIPCRGVELRGNRVVGLIPAAGDVLPCERLVVAAGAWTPLLLPWLGDAMRAVGQPVLHLRPTDPRPFDAERFPVWGADISATGWYGFPATADGIVKVGHHGRGIPMRADERKEVDHAHERRCREFLRESLPGLADAPRVGSRVCRYCDSFDGDFWIGADPHHPGLVVAAGGSGHGFKFAPVLGEIIADALEQRPHAALDRFGWREAGDAGSEQARHDG